MRRNLFLAALVCAALTFPDFATAGPFKQRREARKYRRAAVSPSINYQPAAPTTCVGPDCPLATGPGQITANRKGGFEGQLPDDYYAAYTASVLPGPAVQVVPPSGPMTQVTQVTAKPDSRLSVAAAESRVAELQAQLLAARDAAEQARIEERRQAAKQALEVKQKIEKMKLDFQNQIDDLTARQSGLEPTPAPPQE